MTQRPADALPTRMRRTWRDQLEQQERSAVLAWGAFAGTFAGVRLLTHWLKDGHGPKGGGDQSVRAALSPLQHRDRSVDRHRGRRDPG